MDHHRKKKRNERGSYIGRCLIVFSTCERVRLGIYDFSCRKNENGKNKRKTIKLNMDEKKQQKKQNKKKMLNIWHSKLFFFNEN